MPFKRVYPFVFSFVLAGVVPAPVVRALDLQTAIGRALASDPRLPAGGLEVDAARGGVVQAGKYPNPEFSAEAENFGGSGDVSGFDSAEVTLGIQQKFERGGKRSARIEAARGKEDVANAEIAILRREIVAQTKIDFVKVLGAISTIEMMTRAVKRLESLVPQLEKRVEAGGSLKADLARGRLAAGRARVALEKARIDLKAAKAQLVANWSGSPREASDIFGRLPHNGHKVLAVAELLPLLDRHPAILSWDAVSAERSGDLSVQHSLAVPDVTLGAGVRRLGETDDTAFVITGSIPLPIHDRNQGNIVSSEARLDKVRFEREAARRALQRRLIEAHGEMEAECLESQRVFEVLVPQGRTAADDVQSSFDQGRLTVKDLLDGYAAQLEVETLQIEADTRCHTAAAKVETLVARRPWQTGWEPVSEGTEK